MRTNPLLGFRASGAPHSRGFSLLTRKVCGMGNSWSVSPSGCGACPSVRRRTSRMSSAHWLTAKHTHACVCFAVNQWADDILEVLRRTDGHAPHPLGETLHEFPIPQTFLVNKEKPRECGAPLALKPKSGFVRIGNHAIQVGVGKHNHRVFPSRLKRVGAPPPAAVAFVMPRKRLLNIPAYRERAGEGNACNLLVLQKRSPYFFARAGEKVKHLRWNSRFVDCLCEEMAYDG